MSAPVPVESGQPVRTVCFEARFDQLPALLEALHIPGVDHQAHLRASLAVEELFANTIHYAYGGESASPVWLTVANTGDALRIDYADAGPEFDPFVNIARLEPECTTDVDHRPVGGLGRVLIHHMARKCAYRRENDRNIVSLEYALPG